MEIGLIVLALILATLLGWLLKQSFNTQPWVAEEVSETAHHERRSLRVQVLRRAHRDEGSAKLEVLTDLLDTQLRPIRM